MWIHTATNAINSIQKNGLMAKQKRMDQIKTLLRNYLASSCAILLLVKRKKCGLAVFRQPAVPEMHLNFACGLPRIVR